MDETNIPLMGGRPRHEQISSWLKEQIERGGFAENDQLPSESRLGERFSVSRITVRRALQTLESEGLIYRRQGLGSFVQDTCVSHGLVRLTDFVEDMASAGISARSVVLHFKPEEATSRVASALAVDENTSVVRLDRLRYGDGEPLAFDYTWMTVFQAQLLDGKDLDNETIYSLLERDYNICICKSRFRIEAVNASNEIAQHLDVPWGRALLMIERTSFSENENPIYFQQRFYRCDRVAYELELVRGAEYKHTGSKGFPLREFEPVFKK